MKIVVAAHQSHKFTSRFRFKTIPRCRLGLSSTAKTMVSERRPETQRDTMMYDIPQVDANTDKNGFFVCVCVWFGVVCCVCE